MKLILCFVGLGRNSNAYAGWKSTRDAIERSVYEGKSGGIKLGLDDTLPSYPTLGNTRGIRPDWTEDNFRKRHSQSGIPTAANVIARYWSAGTIKRGAGRGQDRVSLDPLSPILT